MKAVAKLFALISMICAISGVAQAQMQMSISPTGYYTQELPDTDTAVPPTQMPNLSPADAGGAVQSNAAPVQPGPVFEQPIYSHSGTVGQNYFQSNCGNNCNDPCYNNGRMGLGSGNLLSGITNPGYLFLDIGGFLGSSDATTPAATNYPLGDSLIRGAGMGRYLTNDLRFDVSARYRFVEIDSIAGNTTTIDGGSNVWTTMFTLRKDLPGLHPCIKPYISGGIGFADHNTHATTNFGGVPSVAYRENDNVEFAWALGAGISCKMTSHMYLDFDYQFINLGDTATGPNAGGNSIQFNDVEGNELVLRMRYNF